MTTRLPRIRRANAGDQRWNRLRQRVRGICPDGAADVQLELVEGNKFPFGDAEFDIAFCKETLANVSDKPAFYALAGDHPRQTGAEFLASLGVES